MRNRGFATATRPLAGYLFILPALAVYAVFVATPVVESFRLSLYRWPSAFLAPDFVGLDNFTELARDPVFWAALRNNAVLVLFSVVLQLPVAMLLAVLLSYPLRARTFFRTVFFAPMIMPTTAIAVLWSMIYLPEQGLLDRVIRFLYAGYEGFGWLSESGVALASVFVVVSWRYVGFHMVLFMAGIAAVPSQLYEAGRLDGAGEWALFRHVTLPMLSPMIRVAALLSVVGSLKYFDLMYMLAAGAPETSRELLATYVYRLAFASGQGRYGYGSAVAVLLFMAAMAAACAVIWLGRTKATQAGRNRRGRAT